MKISYTLTELKSVNELTAMILPIVSSILTVNNSADEYISADEIRKYTHEIVYKLRNANFAINTKDFKFKINERHAVTIEISTELFVSIIKIYRKLFANKGIDTILNALPNIINDDEIKQCIISLKSIIISKLNANNINLDNIVEDLERELEEECAKLEEKYDLANTFEKIGLQLNGEKDELVK